MHLIDRILDFFLGPPVEPLNLEAERLEAIRHKAESNEALRKARDAFIREPTMKLVMPRLDGTEL
jgi:hypothetical protein